MKDNRIHGVSGLLVSLGMISSMAAVQADETETSAFLEEIVIVGEKTRQNQISGAAHYIGPDKLAEFAYSDIQRVLRQVPGVSIQVEDGYGLRPNISIRGVATERSGRITLLEDNVLVSPAPYSAPSAYYFPTTGRMHAIEILKGPAAITQGPYTIGGAMNMVSTPIPVKAKGSIMVDAGEDKERRVHGTYGARHDSGWGFLLETHQWQSDGYQNIDRSSRDTGLDVADYTVKLGYAALDSRHRFELKLQYADQDSQQSYLGLTDSDFARDAYRRYGISALDNINTEHEQQIIRYQFELSEQLTFTATAYNNEYERNWFKTEGIDFDGSASAEVMSRTSWFNVVQAVNTGNSLAGFSAVELQAVLDGTLDTAPGSIQIRSNARSYFSRGYQFELDWQTDIGSVTHEFNVGVRLHEDEEDRLQRNSSYRQVNGQLQSNDPGLPGNAGNRVQEAKAASLYIQDRIESGKWVVTPGLRYENIDQGRTRYEIRNGRTANPADRSAANICDTRENHTEVWLPGIGAAYAYNKNLSVIAGIHKGFTAPSNSPGVDAEEALNYEFGFRHGAGKTDTEIILFFSDYDNLLGECTASSGSDCTVGDAFNGDAASVSGAEFMLATSLGSSSRYSIPLTFNYTWINSEFDSDVADTDFFGDVKKGDPIPYIPEHQLSLGIGYESGSWRGSLSATWVDEVCVRASCTEFERTDNSLTLDIAASYDAGAAVTLFGKVENLTSTDNIVGRHPYGARPNKGRNLIVGVRYNF